MKRSISILMIEDSPEDADLVFRSIKRGGIEADILRVDTREKLARALDQQTWDAVISDYRLPQLNAPHALRFVRSKNADVPFIVISGAVGEEAAAELMREGAQDFLLKENLARLAPAIIRELKDADIRKQRAEAEKNFLSAQERFQGLFESSRYGIFFMNFEGNFLDFNQAFECLTGYTRAELLLRKHIDLSPAQFHEIERQNVNEAISSGTSAFYEKNYIHKNGNVVPVELTIFVIKRNDQPTGLAAFVKDISIRKRLEQVKDELIGTVSHEMRTPLTIVRGAAENVSLGYAGPLTDTQREAIATIIRNADRLAHIIDNMLDLSFLESKGQKLNFTRVEIKPLIEEIVSSFLEKSTQRNLALQIDCPPRQRVCVDANLVSQVIDNLLSNAFRYFKSRVIVSATLIQNSMKVSVIDDGAGISEEQIKTLFNKFTQVNRPEGGQGYKGTGLGLAICREIIELHNGKIWLESTVGKGSSVHFTIPLEPTAAQSVRSTC